ncbi:hypothetical protein CHCC20441_2260 [Bacillus licheniformis]|uniref:Uncharacterized protein n=1 Tax=Bacillus licheniformis TaxID=1402 RepID=A0A8B5YFX4_BACLI|nr:hypothetical protein MUY_003555 [Bacillus licheniformis WX-02]EQM26282.1 hypothetical protein N399_18745 [Bacillus licheniformis CG-B52]KUL12113.1 hypothetical protein LI17339_08305 [Bacillus licheniformis LMG 17339]KYC73466.1 hypothetical protein B4092_3767 [Bacillus licheniformis]KYC80461.1 hypothetical protein B4090_3798 [Bacillus licheniformis]
MFDGSGTRGATGGTWLNERDTKSGSLVQKNSLRSGCFFCDDQQNNL